MPIDSTQPHTRPREYPLTDTGTFQSLYERKHLAVFRFIYGLNGGPKEDVEDLTMKTFLRAWRSRDRFQGNDAAAFGWLLKIARNLVIDFHRQNKNRLTHIDIDTNFLPSQDLTPEQHFHQKEQIRILWSILNDLSSQQREIIVLRYILGWRVKYIGQHMEMGENYVSVTIRRIINRIQDKWPKDDR